MFLICLWCLLLLCLDRSRLWVCVGVYAVEERGEGGEFVSMFERACELSVLISAGGIVNTRLLMFSSPPPPFLPPLSIQVAVFEGECTFEEIVVEATALAHAKASSVFYGWSITVNGDLVASECAFPFIFLACYTSYSSTCPTLTFIASPVPRFVVAPAPPSHSPPRSATVQADNDIDIGAGGSMVLTDSTHAPRLWVVVGCCRGVC